MKKIFFIISLQLSLFSMATSSDQKSDPYEPKIKIVGFVVEGAPLTQKPPAAPLVIKNFDLSPGSQTSLSRVQTHPPIQRTEVSHNLRNLFDAAQRVKRGSPAAKKTEDK